MTPYFITFLIALILSLILTPFAYRIGLRIGISDAPGGRRQHTHVVSRLGAVPIFASFTVAVLISQSLDVPRLDPQEATRVTGLLVGGGLVFVYGLIDDRVNLRAGWQIVAQLGAALIAISALIIVERFNNPFITDPLIDNQIILEQWQYIPLSIFWILGMMNTVNWLDGLDGLATGVAAIFSVILFFAMIRTTPDQPLPQLSIALLPIALLGTALGFLPFNFHPAKIFLGSGSLFLGFVLASLGIIGGAKVATVLLVLAVPVIDVAWLIISRIRRGQPPTQSGRDHLHYRLLDLGLSQRQVVSLYYFACALFGGLALVIEGSLLKLASLMLLGVITLATLITLSVQKPAESE